MSNRLHQLILAVAITGFAGGVLAQTGPDASPGGAGPERGEHAGHKQWAADGGERDGHWGGHHCHHHHHHHHHWNRGHEEHGWGDGPQGGQGLLRSFHELDLSAAQQQQLHSILSKAREQFATRQPGGAPDMMALANPGDPNYAAAVQAAKKRAADRIQRDSDLKLQLYNVLTPDQKTQWSKLVANWKARMTQRAEGPKGQPDPANR